MNMVRLPLDWEDLPEHLLIRIFLNLNGQSLHRCRQVSRGWNNCIVDNIWGSPSRRTVLEATLRSNWLHETPEVLLDTREVDIKSEVLAVTRDAALLLNMENKSSVRVVEFAADQFWDINIRKGCCVEYTTNGKIVQGSVAGTMIVLVYEQCTHLFDVPAFLGSVGATRNCQQRFRCRQRSLSTLRNTKYFTEVWDRATKQLIIKKEMSCKPIFKNNVAKSDQNTVLMWNEEQGNLHVVHIHEDQSFREYFSEYLALKNGRILDFCYPYALIVGYMEVDGNYVGKIELWEFDNMQMEMKKKASFAKDISIIEEAVLIYPHIAMIEYDLESSDGCYNFSVLNIATQKRLFTSSFCGVVSIKHSNGFIFIEVQRTEGPVIKMYELDKLIENSLESNQMYKPRNIRCHQSLSRTHINKTVMQSVNVHTNCTSIHIKSRDFWSLP